MNSELQNLIQNALIEYIVNKVIEKLEQRQKTALVLFTGASIGFRQSIESLNKLQQNGWQFKVVISKAAEDVLTEDLIKKSLNIESVIKEDDKPDIKELLDQNNLIIIPSLTINTASKIANCISDTLITNIVSKAMMSGKKIIASLNACCIENEERKSIYGDNVSLAYKNKLKNNLETIKSYEIELTTSENLFYKVEKYSKKNLNTNNLVINNQSKDNKKTIDLKQPQDKNSLYIKLDKKVISRADVYENRGYNYIFVDKGSLITDLAKEEAKKLNLKIKQE
ncbi:MAG: flavoprotein [Clostridiales bacterium]|uniref:flavoprotein n=1 Tax=Clostridia TaxID=186801 RepID=UPI0018AB4155|nr:flavoprotein [Clostridium sp. 1001270J_160509_D11]MDU1202119.1 flavoprotein [Clostridiales bacterium]